MKGSYILVILIEKDIEILIGALGKIKFQKGFYFYVGSAMGSYGSSTLANRVKRHLMNKDKKSIHWHIDYLLNDIKTILIKIYLIPSIDPIECFIAGELFKVSKNYIKNFGSTDCKCKSHLFYFKNLHTFEYKISNIDPNQKR
jgi:Uri superfamily endonuclease